MTTEELLQRCQDESASSILDAVDKNYRKRFRRLCKGLDKLIEEIKNDFLEANYYAGDGGSLQLMLTDSHSDGYGDGTPNFEAIAEDCSISTISGGGW